MASIADMERNDRLQGLWDMLVKALPQQQQQRGGFGGNDPMQALGSLGANPDPYTALRFLQLGQALGQMGQGPAQDPNMLQQLLQSFLAQSQGQKR